MAEYRRLLIESIRISSAKGKNPLVTLNKNESHYLRRVLRLGLGDMIEVIDGKGRLWKASLHNEDSIQLISSVQSPEQKRPRSQPLICLAVVLPKRGFEDLLRMSCEIGLDVIQPLNSERSVVKEFREVRRRRWDTIVKEAAEQSERLWALEIKETLSIKDWLNLQQDNSCLAMATTRVPEAKELTLWMEEFTEIAKEVWVLIGPEGGWTLEERDIARTVGCQEVTFGELILRTSTAAVVATELMVNWRRTRNVFRRDLSEN